MRSYHTTYVPLHTICLSCSFSVEVYGIYTCHIGWALFCGNCWRHMFHSLLHAHNWLSFLSQMFSFILWIWKGGPTLTYSIQSYITSESGLETFRWYWKIQDCRNQGFMPRIHRRCQTSQKNKIFHQIFNDKEISRYGNGRALNAGAISQVYNSSRVDLSCKPLAEVSSEHYHNSWGRLCRREAGKYS